MQSISQIIHVYGSRHARKWRRGEDERRSVIFLCTAAQGRNSFGWTPKTYFHQLSTNTEGSIQDLPGAINHKGGRGERKDWESQETPCFYITSLMRNIYIYIYIYIYRSTKWFMFFNYSFCFFWPLFLTFRYLQRMFDNVDCFLVIQWQLSR